MPKVNDPQESLSNFVKEGFKVTAEILQKERQRTNDICSATWETMSRNERPRFVKNLRNKGYTQGEIADMTGTSQPTISLYEKKAKG